MELSVDPLSLRIDQCKGLAVVSVHMSPPGWNPAVSHQDLKSVAAYGRIIVAHHHLVDSFRVVGQVVPEHRRVIASSEMSRRMALLRMDEMGELCRITQEENRRVVR